MKLHPTKIYLLLIVISLLSCTNKEQEIHLKESVQRLEQQNVIGLKANWQLEAIVRDFIFDDDNNGRYDYLPPLVQHFTESARRFSESVSNVTMSDTNNAVTLFSQYQDLQQEYKILKQKILDSFPNAILDTSINGFMNLDKKAFTQKYLGARDTINAKLQLLFMQADAIVNEDFLMERIASLLVPSHRFDPVIAWGSTDKLFYKRGEKLELTAILVKYLPAKIQYAIVNDKRVEVTGNIFQYTQKVTDKPGIHTFRFKLFVKKDGDMETYPVAVTYKVE